MENKQLLYLNNKQLLYKKLNALRLEVDNSVVESIKETVDDLLAASTTEPNNTIDESKKPEKRDFVRWFYSKNKAYFPTPDECFDYIFSQYQEYVLSILKENYKACKNLADEDKERTAQEMVNETYEDLITIFSTKGK